MPVRLSQPVGVVDVAGLLELLGQLGTAGGDEPTGDEDVDDVGPQLDEQPVEVGDREHAEPPFGRRLLDAAGHRAEGVDVEAGVDLVEHAERWTEHAELQHLVALALAAGQVDVQRPLEEALVEADSGRLGPEPRPELVGAGGVAEGPAGEGLGHRRLQPDAGNLDRLLQGEEEPGSGPLPGRSAGQLDAVEPDAATGDDGPRAPHERVGQRALAGPVRPHDDVDLAAADGQADAVDDRAAGDLGVEVLDLEDVVVHGSTTPTSSPTTSTS